MQASRDASTPPRPALCAAHGCAQHDSHGIEVLRRGLKPRPFKANLHRRFLNLWQQAEGGQGVVRADVDFAIGDCRHGEFDCAVERVAVFVLRVVVEFGR